MGRTDEEQKGISRKVEMGKKKETLSKKENSVNTMLRSSTEPHTFKGKKLSKDCPGFKP